MNQQDLRQLLPFGTVVRILNLYANQVITSSCAVEMLRDQANGKSKAVTERIDSLVHSSPPKVSHAELKEWVTQRIEYNQKQLPACHVMNATAYHRGALYELAMILEHLELT